MNKLTHCKLNLTMVKYEFVNFKSRENRKSEYKLNVPIRFRKIVIENCKHRYQ